MAINQAVIFTKPLTTYLFRLPPMHCEIEWKRSCWIAVFISACNGVWMDDLVCARDDGSALYCIQQSRRLDTLDTLVMSEAGLARFEERFGASWEDEKAAGRLMTTNQLLAQKGLAITDLLNAWEEQLAAGQTLKVQSGLIIGFMRPLMRM